MASYKPYICLMYNSYILTYMKYANFIYVVCVTYIFTHIFTYINMYVSYTFRHICWHICRSRHICLHICHFLYVSYMTFPYGFPPFPSHPFASRMEGSQSHLPLLSLPPPSSPSPGVPPLNQLGGLGERYKLPQWGMWRSPSRQTIWCISGPKE